MRLIVIVIVALFFQDVPYKSKEEFELKLDLQFKNRPINTETAYTAKQASNTPLPYLTVDLTVTKVLDDESKIKVLNNTGKAVEVVNLAKRNTVSLDLGFADDLKDQVTSHIYSVNFYSEDKQLKRKILIEFQQDGSYLVNGEKRGRI